MKRYAVLKAMIVGAIGFERLAVSAADPSVTTATWGSVGGIYDGVITDGAHWIGGTTPGPLTKASFSQSSSYTVTLPEDGYETLANFVFNSPPAHTFTLDATGSFFLQKEATADNYVSQPFFIQEDGKSFARIETAAGATKYTAAQSFLSNTVMKITGATAEDSVGYPRVDVTGGIFNLFDPTGEPPAATNDFRIFVAEAFDAARFTFTDVAARFPNVIYHGNQTGLSELRFSGGDAYVAGRVAFNDARHAPGATNLLHVTDGGNVTIGGGILVKMNTGGDSARMKSICSLVAEGDGSTLAINGNISYEANWDNFMFFNARQGGTIKFGGGSTWNFGSALAVASGTVAPSCATALVHVANGTLAIGSDASKASFILGNGPNAYAELRVEGDDAKVDLYASAHQHVGYSANSTKGSVGVINILGGETTFHEGNSWRVYLGSGNAGVTGIVNVAGGKFTVEGGYGLGVQYGVGFINVSGGELNVRCMPICSESSASAAESVVCQTGGKIVVTKYTGSYRGGGMFDGVQITTNDKTNRKARLVLDGGVLEANMILGGPSARVNGGTGYAAFEADGGTIRVNGTANWLLETFDEAKLGEKGLVIESDHAATIRQAFTDKDGVNGRLVLSGSGVKTLSGASTVSEIAISGGTVSFDAAACPQSVVVVTNNATVDFDGGASGGNLKGLKIGDGTSPGNLAISSDETFAVSGDIDLSNVRLVLSGDFAAGSTHTMITATGNISAGSVQAWREAFVVSGLPDGLSCDFTVEQEGGVTSFKASVREAQDLTIRVDEGVSNLTETLVFSVNDTLHAIVASGATLNLSGEIAGGIVSKEGAGIMNISHASNRTAGNVTLEAGTLAATSADALGWYDTINLGVFTIKGGTLTLSDPVADAYFPWVLAPSLAASADPYVIKTDSDVVLPAPVSAGSGCMIKRGAGRLTFLSGSGLTAFASSRGANVKDGTVGTATMVFDADGTPPSSNYASVTVAEGEMRLAPGQGGSFAVTATSVQGVTYVGVPLKGGSAEPGFVVDGVTAKMSETGSSHFHLGCGLTDANSDVRRPYLYVTNGATLNVTSLQTAWASTGSSKPIVRVDGSTLYISEYLYVLRGGTEGDEPTYRFTNGSRLFVDYSGKHGVEFMGKAATMEFDNSIFARNANRDRARVWMNGASGTMKFSNGAVMYVENFLLQNSNDVLTLVFAGGEWSPASTNYTLAAAYPSCIVFKPDAGGLLMNPPSGKKWTMAAAVFKAGEGAITHNGAGELAFEDGVLESGVALAGGGTYSGTFPESKLVVPMDDDGTVATPMNFTDSVFTGTVTVDLGRGEDDPLPKPYPANVAVANISGDVSGVTRWKIAGTGFARARGKVKLENGTLKVSVLPPAGIVIDIR